MSSAGHKLSIPELLTRALRSPDDKTTLSALRDRRREVVKFLNESDFKLDDEQSSMIEDHPESLAAIYDAISETTELGPEDRRALERALDFKRQGDLEIGAAFKTLLGTLSPRTELRELIGRLQAADAPRVEKDVLAIVEEQPDVRAALPDCRPLLEFGIRPLSVFYATEAPLSLVAETNEFRPGTSFEIGPAQDEGTAHFSGLSPDHPIIQEVVAMTELHASAAQQLWGWLATVGLTSHAFLFGGFKCIRLNGDDGVHLQLEVLPRRLTLGEQWTNTISREERRGQPQEKRRPAESY